MTIESQTPEEDFSAAFAQFSDEKTDPAPEGVRDEPAPEPAPAVAEPAAEPAATADPEPATDPEPAAPEAVAEPEPVAANPEPAAPAEPDTDAILKRLAEAVKATPVEEKPEVVAPAVEEPPAIYSAEEQAQLDSYEKEWGDVSKGEALKRRAEYRELLGYVFDQVNKHFGPVKEMAEALAERTHLQDVKTAVPDYSDNLRDQVVDWVNKQPTYLQAAYNQVIQQGTSDEVKDLIDRYRKETGTGGPAPKPSKQVTELSEPAKQAAAALAPVETKRSVTPATEDMSNFDDAFTQFSKLANTM